MAENVSLRVDNARALSCLLLPMEFGCGLRCGNNSILYLFKAELCLRQKKWQWGDLFAVEWAHEPFVMWHGRPRKQ